ncbi:hypothetical protein IWW56_002641 [Coemansia sp. RSA 2131]|nr:hypothetical protein IWW56_002641 [Coemansia sp. RSA 2131]
MNIENRPNTKPVSTWGLDPLFWTPAKLFVGDLHAALPSDSASVFFIGTHVVRTVQAVGIVVSVDTRSPKLTVYNGKHYSKLDDGTGVIPCAQFVAPDEVAAMCQPFDLGSTVSVEGRLSTFRDVRQVVIRSIKHIDPNQEVLGWLERLALRQFLQSSIEPQI